MSGNGDERAPADPAETWQRLQNLPPAQPATRRPAPDDQPWGGSAAPVAARSDQGPPPGGARRHVVIEAGQQVVRPGRDGGAPGGLDGAGPLDAGAAARVAPPPGPLSSPPRSRVVVPAPARPAPDRPRPARRSPRPFPVRRVVLASVAALALLLVGLVVWGARKFDEIPRVPVADVLSPAGAGTNWLIVGTDSREGLSADDANAGAFLGPGEPTGSRTDSIMVLRLQGDHQSLLSIPRDLVVKDPKSGSMGRINATFSAGPANLIKAVQSLGIPVHHYLEINFVSFSRLVDAVGGINVEFPFPARDQHSGLDVPEAGVQHLGGTQALAYVRSRYYEELKNGKWVQDPLSDLGRVQRQRTFLTALMSEVAGTRNPMKLGGIADALSVGMKIDDTLGLFGAIGLAMQLRGFHPESVTLPTVNARLGAAAVLHLKQPEANGVIQSFAG